MARELDMRASPYDLYSYEPDKTILDKNKTNFLPEPAYLRDHPEGFTFEKTPICIETLEVFICH